MSDGDVPKYASLLKLQFAFQGLNEAQMAHLVSRLEQVHVPQDTAIISEGEAVNYFYIIYSGKVKAVRQAGETEPQTVVFGQGDYFGEEALINDRPDTATFTALEAVSLLRLSSQDFNALILESPAVEEALKATIHSRHLAEARNFDWLGEEEVIYLLARKHVIFLATAMILPAVIALVGLLGIGLSFMRMPAAFANLIFIGGIIFLVAAILLAIWNGVDWGNDYYILTNRRVVWLEKVVLLYFSRREAPLTQILAVNVRSSFLGRVFNYGNIEVRTYTGGILMRHADNAYRFQSFVEVFELRARERVKQLEAEKMELALRQRLGLEKPAEPAPATPVEPAGAQPQKPEKTSVLRHFLNTFLEIRYEENGVITYRKHWLILIKQTLLPTLAFLAFTALVIFLDVKNILTGPAVFLLYMLVYVVIVAWWLYNFVNWINDIYQVTPDQIVDIEKKPLGQELKKTASLDSILSIEHDREGIIQILFNYGFVRVMVGQTPFMFYYVKNPDQVQQDISYYIEARRRKKLEAEEAVERERMLDWLATYHSQSETLEEIEKKTDWDLFPG